MNTSTWIIAAVVISFMALCLSVGLALVFAGVKLSELPKVIWEIANQHSDPNIRRWDQSTGKEIR